MKSRCAVKFHRTPRQSKFHVFRGVWENHKATCGLGKRVSCVTCMGNTWNMGGPSVMPLGLHELGGGHVSSHPHT